MWCYPTSLTMYVWRSISAACVTFWILQRLIRTRGQGDAALKDRVVKTKSNETLKVSVPSPGAPGSKPHQYDVFINHRGPDVKMAFVAHLNAALRRDGFRPFLDAKDIGQGRHVFKSIDKALSGTCVHVAIFSKRYAESKYCLNELCDMLKSGQVVLPVFYGVNAEDLRWIENGPFKEGFEKHVKRGRVEEVRKWKEALREIADYRGFRLDEVNGDEEQLVRSILVEARHAMPVTLLPGKHRYGMEESMKDVLKALESVSVVGLVGMGGIGKTTLAVGIYNHFVSLRQFERHCFLKDVRSSEPSHLQRDLLKGLGHDSELQSVGPQDYRRAFEGLMCQRVLVVVDDIDCSSQFEALIPSIQELGVGSRVVITSRQRDALKHAMAGAACQGMYEVPLLNGMDSRRLFNRHAFLSERPSEGFGDLAAEVADACGGHALSLEVIGASLFDKRGSEDREIWMEAGRALQENNDIFDKLRSTYDRLPSDGDRSMFRDIACMLMGMEKGAALTIWKSCSSPMHQCSTSRTPGLALRRLMDRSLVKLDEDGRLRMHDVLRDMGRDIVKKEAQRADGRTHLWDAATASTVLSYGGTNTSVRGIRLGIPQDTTNKSYEFAGSLKDGGVSCDASQLTSMKELHLLILDGCHVVAPDGFSGWPQELRWIQWRGYCFAKLPSQLKLPYLVVLDLSNSKKLTRLWENDAHIQLPLLQTLNLSSCSGLEVLAESFGQSVPRLRRLQMAVCMSLRRLPDSIGQLTDLEDLDLRACKMLVRLPDAIVGLGSLRTLNLHGCRSLQQLPEEFGKLTNLDTLDVASCASFSELPASIGGLKALKTLKMLFIAVKDLPAEFGLLTSLSSLEMSGLRSVPGTFKGLQALTSLLLWTVFGEMGDLGALTALKDVFICQYYTITTLPVSLGNLKFLVTLEMSSCPELSTVEALPEGLERLRLTECPKLREIPSLAGMWSLVELDLGECRSLRHVHGLECLTSLEVMNVSGCTSMEGRRIIAKEMRGLRDCNVSGSKVGVAYDNRWLEREPAEQVITCLVDAIPVLPNGMGKVVVVRDDLYSRLVVEATNSSEAECMALICCLLVCGNRGREGLWNMKVEVLRGGRLIMESTTWLDRVWPADRNQVLMCTLRREHDVVQSLQHGDQICVSLTIYPGSESVRMTVVEGAVCVVHNGDENLVMTVNSEVLSRSQSEVLATQFGQLVLEDKAEQTQDASGT